MRVIALDMLKFEVDPVPGEEGGDFRRRCDLSKTQAPAIRSTQTVCELSKLQSRLYLASIADESSAMDSVTIRCVGSGWPAPERLATQLSSCVDVFFRLILST